MIHPNTVAKAYAKFVQSGDRTALLSSHLLDDVERVADRILIMVNGRIAVDCPLESLVDRVSSCTVELDDDTTELGQIPRLIHARRIGKRCVLTLVDFDSQTQEALQRIGGENLSRNPGNLYLLEPKRRVVGGLFKCPPASDGWLTERSRSAK